MLRRFHPLTNEELFLPAVMERLFSLQRLLAAVQRTAEGLNQGRGGNGAARGCTQRQASMTPQAAGLWVAQMGKENMGKGRRRAISDHTERKHLLRYPGREAHQAVEDRGLECR